MPHRRPKLDHYASHLFLPCHAVSLDRDQAQLDQVEIDSSIGDRSEGISADEPLAPSQQRH